jgi:hypothetical protein
MLSDAIHLRNLLNEIVKFRPLVRTIDFAGVIELDSELVERIKLLITPTSEGSDTLTRIILNFGSLNLGLNTNLFDDSLNLLNL